MKTRARPLAHRRKTLFPPRMILAPLDFSECSEASLAAARLLARRFACRLELAHIDSGPPPAVSQTAMEAVARRGLAAYEEGLRSKLEAARAGLEHSGVHLVSGDPETVLPRLAHDAAADLVVMGTHGRTGLRRLALGSVAEAAVHVCRAPILVTRKSPSEKWPLRILAPVKWTDYADETLRTAVAWARFMGAELGVLSVAEEDGLMEVPHDELRDHVERLLDHGDPEPQWLWRKGRPYEAIIETAEAEGYDLIVVSAHARGRLHDALIGTTAERVIRCSRVPVLAVPSQAAR
ncbi:MAG: universal stress protein [Elusimicrobia bacterium]|nr:universal stress protein [Elusimicrobiota bacterium]